MFGPEAAFKGQAVLSLGYESPSGNSLNYRRVLKGSAKFLHMLISNKDISQNNLPLPAPIWVYRTEQSYERLLAVSWDIWDLFPRMP